MKKIDCLFKLANYYKIIRQYFEDLAVLEVQTPLAYSYPVTDPYIDNFEIMTQAGRRYLQSSPEYAMKRLLAKGSGSIYQICKSFRDDPISAIHNFEFTMLEWYRVEVDEQALMKEIKQLLLLLSPNAKVHFFSYQALFEQHLQSNPHQLALLDLQKLVLQYIGEIEGIKTPNMLECFDLLFTHCIEPKLKAYDFVFVYHYPKELSALAKLVIDEKDQQVAARFELFYQGVELANGYHELTDQSEQLQRFKKDLSLRDSLNKPVHPIDTQLLKVLEDMPECAGVAMGLDRLIMCLEDKSRIDEMSCL